MQLKKFFLFALTYIAISLPFQSFAQKEKEDSLHISNIYFKADNNSWLIDSVYLIENDLYSVHRVDNTKKILNSFYQTLSTLGGASQSLEYTPQKPTYDFLPNLFEPYFHTLENINFYQLSNPYSLLKYSNDINSSQYFSIIHAQNLAKGLNVAIKYDVNYADGIFATSQVMNQFFDFTSNYISKNGRYRALLSFIRNRAYVNENGGILHDSLWTNSSYSKPETYPTLFTSAYSQYKNYNASLTQHYILNKEKKLGAISHQIIYEDLTRLFNNLETQKADSTNQIKIENTLSWTNKTESKQNFFIPLNIGITHRLLSYSNTDTYFKNQISPFASIGLNLKNFDLEGRYTQIFSESKENEHQAIVKASYKKRITLQAEQNKAYGNYYIQYYGKTNPTLTNSLKLNYNTKNLNIDLSYNQVENATYIDEKLQIIQIKEKANLFSAKLMYDYNIGILNTKGQVLYQKTDNTEAIRLPEFQAKASLAIKVNLFGGKMTSLFGVDLNYFSAYYADVYNAEIGFFTRQNQELIGNYLYADIFANIKISQCNLFIALEHPYAGLISNNYFSTPHYPHSGLSFRWGLSWELWN
ncbi:MAG: hypothetical protein IKV46_04330 [Bacteroidales bacterium]|nr:hypothetical protein [Bacteroidales bacterium]